jgi:hypothetical protein
MKSTLFLLILILIFSASLFEGCKNETPSENPQKDIIGKWKSTQRSLVLEFNPDQTVNATLETEHITNNMSSETKFIDDSQIVVTWDSNIEICEIKVYTDHFVVINPKGKKEKFVRIE